MEKRIPSLSPKAKTVLQGLAIIAGVILSGILLDVPVALYGGIWWTAGLVLGAMGLGLMLGVPLAVGQVYGCKVTRTLVGGYVWLFRGVPVLVQLYLFYFGIMAWMGDQPALSWLPTNSAFFAAIMVLGLTSAAYQSQIFRGSIQSPAHRASSRPPGPWA